VARADASFLNFGLQQDIAERANSRESVDALASLYSYQALRDVIAGKSIL